MGSCGASVALWRAFPFVIVGASVLGALFFALKGLKMSVKRMRKMVRQMSARDVGEELSYLVQLHGPDRRSWCGTCIIAVRLMLDELDNPQSFCIDLEVAEPLRLDPSSTVVPGTVFRVDLVEVAQWSIKGLPLVNGPAHYGEMLLPDGSGASAVSPAASSSVIRATVGSA